MTSFSVDWERPLVEAVVLAAVRARPEEARFLAERERRYEIADPEAREEAFAALHRAWFARLGLDDPLVSALAEASEIAARCARGVVARAPAPADEAADLLVAAPGPPTLLVRVRPSTVCVPERFLRLLRHELRHVADMLTPGFGYEPRLPAAEDGLDRASALAGRYRVLWDAFVDGRLFRAGRAPASVHTERRADFARAFPELGSGAEAAFERFFNAVDLTHADLAAFARQH